MLECAVSKVAETQFVRRRGRQRGASRIGNNMVRLYADQVCGEPWGLFGGEPRCFQAEASATLVAWHMVQRMRPMLHTCNYMYSASIAGLATT